MATIRLQTVTGKDLEQYVPELARLRIEVFRAFPYLYEGSLDYEQAYLQTYLRCPDAAIILAFEQDKVIGASSCIPMRDEDVAFQQPFLDHPEVLAPRGSIQSLFYCGESVLDAQYRGQGLGVAFFREREAHAARLGGFTHSCFCAVDRPENHPLRPSQYVPLDQFWRKRGYAKQPQLVAEFTWKDVDQPAATSKTMTFWLKELPS